MYQVCGLESNLNIHNKIFLQNWKNIQNTLDTLSLLSYLLNDWNYEWTRQTDWHKILFIEKLLIGDSALAELQHYCFVTFRFMEIICIDQGEF